MLASASGNPAGELAAVFGETADADADTVWVLILCGVMAFGLALAGVVHLAKVIKTKAEERRMNH